MTLAKRIYNVLLVSAAKKGNTALRSFFSGERFGQITLVDTAAKARRRMAEGEEGLITSGEVYCFLETSGSTEEGKKIPITVDSLKRYGDVMDRYLRISTEEEEGKRFFLSYLGTDLRQPLDPKDTLIFTSAYYRYLAEQGLFDTETVQWRI